MLGNIKMLLTGAAISLLFPGCVMLGPDYHLIQPDAPASWQADISGGLSGQSVDPAELARWWAKLNDPLLAELEQTGLRGNLDLKAAMSRVREARALRSISHSGLFPNINASAGAKKSRGSDNASTF